MKKVILSLVVLSIAAGQLLASERIDLLYETFQNINGSMEATDPLDQSQLDNPVGWTFTNAYAGPQCVIIKRGHRYHAAHSRTDRQCRLLFLN